MKRPENEFTLWMKSHLKSLSSVDACKYVNQELLNGDPRKLLPRCGLQLPIPDKTVLLWMHKCGAETHWYKTSYYNDVRERPDVLSYRTEYRETK
jgi:hypothetical protein